ncbi:hypothetical protein SELMODRAFT_411153 [Selaginella moellendorffii]|uniref:Acyl-[acyl-carrier-protein] desaturase n=1 Tax=Selaginella moellendorffii TaxID=88036 RepID=D8RGR0_SELML|nr:hypothetical protein SELMODRAFT_411153 [Selaginella moellendorffii]
MTTKEALPTYLTMLNTLDGTRDETGASPSPWTVWGRAWTAEENRHGDLLNKYLYRTGRVDMKQIEKTIQSEPPPSLTATLLATPRSTETTSSRVCGLIAADEKWHENAYTRIVEKLFEIDPEGAMLGLEDMMRKISMPAHLMYDGQDKNLFEHFSLVAQRTGVYTTKDYAGILVKRWNVESITGLSARALKTQDFVCGLPPRILRLDERAQSRVKKGPKTNWIFNRESRSLGVKGKRCTL